MLRNTKKPPPEGSGFFSFWSLIGGISHVKFAGFGQRCALASVLPRVPGFLATPFRVVYDVTQHAPFPFFYLRRLSILRAVTSPIAWNTMTSTTHKSTAKIMTSVWKRW